MELQCPFCGHSCAVRSFACHVYSESTGRRSYTGLAKCPACECSPHYICPFCGFRTDHLSEDKLYNHVRACLGYAAALLVGDAEKVHFYWGDET